MALLAASGGDTVKLFDVSVQSGDPCTLCYMPSPGCLVNSVEWNHTNLVVASAGDDKKINFWRVNGHSRGSLPVPAADGGDNIEVTFPTVYLIASSSTCSIPVGCEMHDAICVWLVPLNAGNPVTEDKNWGEFLGKYCEEDVLCINFSNKGSRYLCSGGSGQVMIWDLQRKRCIKSLIGDLIVHNLASGAKATELKDPNKQVLWVLDYSRVSRHLLVTAGDDGSIHMWDTTSRSPKVSWSKQHSAPIAGVSFSPTNDKIIASVGLDKKLYTFDSGMRKESFFIAYEVPSSSLAFRDDGWILAAGTSNGRVVFYDVRGKPHPFTVLRAFVNSEAVTGLCWQRSKAVVLNESNCTDETALFGGAFEDSVLMPDPLPSAASLSLSTPSVSGPRNSGRSSYSIESFPLLQPLLRKHHIEALSGQVARWENYICKEVITSRMIWMSSPRL
ncbi:hypothetical protein Dimus_021300 [Dionaea muscipula]